MEESKQACGVKAQLTEAVSCDFSLLKMKMVEQILLFRQKGYHELDAVGVRLQCCLGRCSMLCVGGVMDVDVLLLQPPVCMWHVT